MHGLIEKRIDFFIRHFVFSTLIPAIFLSHGFLFLFSTKLVFALFSPCLEILVHNPFHFSWIWFYNSLSYKQIRALLANTRTLIGMPAFHANKA